MRGSRGSASKSPKPDVLEAALNNRGDVLNNTVEGEGVPSLPNAPSNGGVDGGLLVSAAAPKPEVGEGGVVVVVEVAVEEPPDLSGPRAVQQEVISVFIAGA
jgi:hypothetical protein